MAASPASRDAPALDGAGRHSEVDRRRKGGRKAPATYRSAMLCRRQGFRSPKENDARGRPPSQALVDGVLADAPERESLLLGRRHVFSLWVFEGEVVESRQGIGTVGRLDGGAGGR